MPWGYAILCRARWVEVGCDMHSANIFALKGASAGQTHLSQELVTIPPAIQRRCEYGIREAVQTHTVLLRSTRALYSLPSLLVLHESAAIAISPLALTHLPSPSPALQQDCSRRSSSPPCDPAAP